MIENQVNVDDQNTKQFNQNPVSQPTQTPRKPKVNNWIIFAIASCILLVAAVIGGTYYFGNRKQEKEISKQISTGSASLTPTTNATNTLTFTDGTHVQFEYSSRWKLGKFEHFPDMLTLQPAENFIPESQNNSIVISVSNHCLNTQCLTVFNLDEMVNRMNAKIVTQARAKNVHGYKILLSDGKTGFVFIKGTDFVMVSTDRYVSEMEKVVLSLQLLAPDTKKMGSLKTYNSGNFTLKYPLEWKVTTRQIEYYDSPTLILTKTGSTKMPGGYELPQVWIGSFEIYSTSGAICSNEPYCERNGKISIKIKGKSYSTDVFKKQIWESGKFTGKYFYVFQIGSQSELEAIPSKPTITGQFSNATERAEIEGILSSITY